MRPGYKQTEVGVIPEDWEVKPLGGVVDFLDGKRRPVKDSDRAKMRGDVPYYGASGIVDYVNDHLFDEDLVLLGEDGENILSRNSRLAFKITGKAWVNNHAHVLKPKPGMSLDYLAEFLESRDYTQFNTGTAQPKLTKLTCSALPVLCPPQLEQRAIAEALRDVDGLLAALDRLIAKKRDLKQAAMQQLLTGQTRLPGFHGEWEVKQIAEIATSTPDKNSGGATLPVLTCSKHLGFVDSLGYFKNQVFSKDLSTYKIIRRGQIGYPANHIEEGSIGLQDLYDVAVVSPIYVVFSVVESVNSFFLHRVLKLESYREKFKVATTSSVDRRGSLRWPAFSKITVALPPPPEQTAIAEVLSDMDAELATLEQRREKTRLLKQAMMQELLTGRTRLVPPGGRE